MRVVALQRTLNQVVMLLFAGSLSVISVILMQLTNWPIGYLTLGIVIGFFADAIRNAVAGRLVEYADDRCAYRKVWYGQPEARGTHRIVANPLVPATPPFPGHRTSHLSLQEEQTLLVQTDAPIENEVCIHCGFANPLLDWYPYDPRLHYTDCMVPELRSLVDQILICPQELLDAQCVEPPLP